MPSLFDVVSVEYHDELDPLLWDGDHLKIDVRIALLKSAAAFCEFIDIEDLTIVGIHLTGSNASYNYTKYSDIDVHIVIDFASQHCPDLIANLLITKKTLWNQTHDHVKVNGYAVEIYPEDIKEHTKSAGVYDILNGKWITKPEKVEPDYDSVAVSTKVKHLAAQIDSLADSSSQDDIADMFTKLKDMRKAGLEDAGEFSTENLAFKTLRNLGYIEKLAKARQKAQDDDLSLDDRKCAEAICEAPEGGLHRCTVQTVNAFADYYHFRPITHDGDIPINGAQVDDYLEHQGLHGMMFNVTGQTVRNFVNAHRTGTYFLSTDGHAMALINGNLIDAAQKGPDARPLVSAVEFRR